MPTRVLLVPSHFLFHLGAGGTPHELPQGYGEILTPEFLTWRILSYKWEHELPQKYVSVYRACLYALLDLGCFTSAFSICANRKRNTLICAKRDWCQIYYKGFVVAQFSFYCRDRTLPLVSLTEWPERHREKDVFDWDSEGWRKFFLTEIRTYSTIKLAHQGLEQGARNFFNAVLGLVPRDF